MGVIFFLITISFAVLACAVPHNYRRSYPSESLGSLAGTHGFNQTFDYVIIGAGNAGMATHRRIASPTS